MPKITKIERQKNNDKRVSVFIDEEYAFSVFDELVFVYHLDPGKDVNTVDLKALCEEDEYKRALDRACKNMSRTEKSEKQIFELLEKCGFKPETIQRAVSHLKHIGLIDDERLAETYVERNKSLGARGLSFKLRQRGISQEIIDKYIVELDEEALATAIAEKQLKKNSKFDKIKQKQKTAEFLVRHGFSWDVALSSIEKVLEAQDV